MAKKRNYSVFYPPRLPIKLSEFIPMKKFSFTFRVTGQKRAYAITQGNVNENFLTEPCESYPDSVRSVS